MVISSIPQPAEVERPRRVTFPALLQDNSTQNVWLALNEKTGVFLFSGRTPGMNPPMPVGTLAEISFHAIPENWTVYLHPITLQQGLP